MRIIAMTIEHNRNKWTNKKKMNKKIKSKLRKQK